MNKKTFLTTILMTVMAVSPVFVASAQEVAGPALVAPESVIISPEQALLAELADLQIKEQDPTVGTFTKWVLRFRIRQIENQIKIKEALQ